MLIVCIEIHFHRNLVFLDKFSVQDNQSVNSVRTCYHFITILRRPHSHPNYYGRKLGLKNRKKKTWNLLHKQRYLSDVDYVEHINGGKRIPFPSWNDWFSSANACFPFVMDILLPYTGTWFCWWCTTITS